MSSPQLVAMLVCFYLGFSKVIVAKGQSWGLKTEVFWSPKFVMTPGSVINRFYEDIDFPKGHIGVKSFDAEVVDEAGVPVTLEDTYLHHWVVVRDYRNLNNHSDIMDADNGGVCPNLGQFFGLGSETRKTSTHVPDPYAIQLGNPNEIPAGYEEIWILNVHAIDTRGVVDKLGCTECRCHLYNVTIDEYGRPLNPSYDGGKDCCYDQTQCRLKQGFDTTASRRGLYLKYTVKWFDWESDSSLIPVQILIFDVTDEFKPDTDQKLGSVGKHNCQVEYKVEPCNSFGLAAVEEACVHTKKSSFPVSKGGYVVHGVAHQHSGGNGSALYGEDGRLICSSMPIYGNGHEAGNENGYIVGMSSCYPRPGSVKLNAGETLHLISNYSNAQKHTGVMGLFYVLIADHVAEPMYLLGANSESISSRLLVQLLNMLENVKFASWAALMVCATIASAIIVHYRRSREDMDGYSLAI